jgi:hypothetical protein
MRRLLMSLVVLMSAGAAHAAPLELHRGVGLHEWLNWAPLASDGSYRWPPYDTVAEWLTRYRPLSDWPEGDPFVAIKSLGFDFVRLTVDPGPLLDSDGERRQVALGVLRAGVEKLTGAGLKVVFNLHSISQVPRYSKDVINAAADSAEIAGYEAMSVDVARMLAPLGVDKVAFEPFNEPAHYPCDDTGSEDWQTIMTDTVKAVRGVSPDLTIIATGACGGDVQGLVDIRPDFDDENILYSFHMYEPHLFTHQRSDNEGDFASGLPWPASAGSAGSVVDALAAHMSAAGLTQEQQGRNLNEVSPFIEQYFVEDWGEAQLEARIGQAVEWARANDIPAGRLFMGEFGAMLMSPDGRSGAFDADRLRYLAAVRTEAERYNIPWAVWEYSNPYGMSVIVPEGPAVADREMLKALGM